MKYILVSAAAVMAITGAAAIGNAQMQDKGQGPGATGGGAGGGGGGTGGGAAERSPSGGGAERSPGAGEKAQQQPSRDQKSQPGKGAEGQPGKGEPKAARQPDDRKTDRKSSTDQGTRDKDTKKSADQPQRGDQKKAADQGQRDKDTKQSADQQRQQDQKKSADQQRQQRDEKKAADQQQDQRKAADKQRQPGDRDQKAAQGGDQKRVQVSDPQRTSVREHVTRDRNIERINRSRLNININVGTAFPRSVRLHTLPVTLVSTIPAYRGYSYVVLEDDTICVVDPRTYVIVDVIDARGGGMRAERSGGAQLTLNQEDMRFIYRAVPKDRTANVRVRLALGAEVPRDVELYDFPAEVVERVPDIRRYRYVVVEDEIVIVDPTDYNVALVVNE